jgi:hypothetical protein
MAIHAMLGTLLLPPALTDALHRTVLYNQLLYALWRLAPGAHATVDAEAAATVLLRTDAVCHPHAPDARECSALLCALAVALRLPHAMWMDSLHSDVHAAVRCVRAVPDAAQPPQHVAGEIDLGTTLDARTVQPSSAEAE